MKRIFSVIFILAVSIPAALLAQDQASAEVSNIAVCTSVENRQPVGTDSVFDAGVGKLYCFTKIVGMADTSEISHVWFYEDKEMTKVDLAVKAKTWRTWSAKTILPEWKGAWRVEVHDQEDNILASISFTLK
jgi:hypothetical protein